jgi:hypothetical protein
MKSPRVYELARQLGVESKIVLQILEELGFTLRSASSQVPAKALTPLKQKIMERNFESTENDEADTRGDLGGPISDVDSRARNLIMQAFEIAHRSGRPDWRTMTVAVLKNRLLNLTERSFREKDYGARTITEFVRRYPDLLLLDDSSTPPKVTLHATTTRPAAPSVAEQSRIRPDLWNAMVDYQSGLTYVWDGLMALPLEVSASTRTEGTQVLPTISVDDTDTWRREFLIDHEDLIGDDPNTIGQARRWAENRLGTRYLPASLRTPWNNEFKRRVLDRLTTWFAEQGLLLPADLLQARPVVRNQNVAADTLRQLVLKCVSVMTEDELRQLSLPPSAVLRAYGTAAPERGRTSRSE